MVEYEFQIYGRVQGVGFRYFVLDVAKENDISGFVQNQSNGSVLCVASGLPEKMRAFEQQIRQGPMHSRIESVSKKVSGRKIKLGFEIR